MSSAERHDLWRRFLTLAGILAAGVIYPLLDLYGKNPEVFVANRSSTTQIVLFGLLVAVTPLLATLGLLSLGMAVGEKAGSIVYWTLLVLGSLATGLVISRQVAPDNTWTALAVAAAVAGLVLVVHRFAPDVLRAFSLAGPVVLILFLATSPTAHLAWAAPVESGPESDTVGNPAPLVLIQLDEFPIASLLNRDAEINADLFPGFARLASEGTWYRNAYSNSMATTQSVPSVLTGKLGAKDLAPTAADHPENLFTLLDGIYEFHVIEWVAHLCPTEECEQFAGRSPARFASLLSDLGVVYGHLSLPRTLRERLPSIDNSWKGFLGQVENPGTPSIRVDAFPVPEPPLRLSWIDDLQRLINGISADGPPALSYTHIQSPHAPWQVNPSGTHYLRPEQYDEVDGVETGGQWITDPYLTRLGFQRHLLQLGFLDQMLGELFDRMEDEGIWDGAMVIIVADHGASFVPGQHRRWPYDENRDDLYRIPLFVKYPGQTGGAIVDEPAFAIDVLPTIVEALEVETDWEFDGISLLHVAGTNRAQQVIPWCCNTEPVTTDLAGLRTQVEHNYERVPDMSSWEKVVAVGPYAGLVGSAVDSLGRVSDTPLRWNIENAAAIEVFDTDDGVAQTLVFGRLELPDQPLERDILITINGVVAGTGFMTVDGPGTAELRGLVAESLLRDGNNDLLILAREENGGWITGTSAMLDVEFTADDGHTLNVQPEGGKRITVDKVSLENGSWVITGWSVDVNAKLKPDRLYVFVGDVLVASGPPNVDNPNVVRWYGSDDLLRSGFEFTIDQAEIPEGVQRITIVAEYGSVAIANPVTLID